MALAIVARNVALSVKDSCRIYGGKFIKTRGVGELRVGKEQLSFHSSRRGREPGTLSFFICINFGS